MTHQKISAFEQSLPTDFFMRVHKSYLIAVDKINSITATSMTIDKTEIPIGQTYKSQVVKLIEGPTE